MPFSIAGDGRGTVGRCHRRRGRRPCRSMSFAMLRTRKAASGSASTEADHCAVGRPPDAEVGDDTAHAALERAGRVLPELAEPAAPQA